MPSARRVTLIVMLDAPPKTGHQTPANGAMPVPAAGPLAAARRYWWLVLLVVLAFIACGVYAAQRRPPVYTAETRLAVGRVDISAPGALSSFALATQALASQYSRSIDAEGVTSRVGRRLGLTQLQVSERISASPIPQSPVMRVFGRGADAAHAVAVSNAASDALVAYTTGLNRTNPDGPRLLRRFRETSTQVLRAQARLDTVRRQHANAPTDATRARVLAARVGLSVAQLQEQTARVAYDTSTRSQAATSLVQVLQRARTATSDRVRYMQFFGFAGLLAGLAVGVALATLLARRRRRRHPAV
jgi:uncharacterized protein involved in exopolysaccharide biosynthesis